MSQVRILSPLPWSGTVGRAWYVPPAPSGVSGVGAAPVCSPRLRGWSRPGLGRAHLVLDVTALTALSGNRQVSALIHRAHFEAETRLWVPVLSALEADREHPGLAEHLGQLDAIHTVGVVEQ